MSIQQRNHDIYVADLERVCKEWAETSQNNYQRAKRYYEALQLISAPTYGIQSIMEDYEIDSIPYLEAALSYYYKLVTSYQATARSAIAGVEGVEDTLRDFVQSQRRDPELDSIVEANIEQLYEE